MSDQLIDPAKLKKVPLSDIRPNTYNPKDKETKEYYQVKESIRVNGLMGFITVRENPNGESNYEIIDGEQRWRACSALEYTEVLIYDEGIISDKRAKELTLWWQAQVPFNKNELAKMIHSMIEEYGEIQSYFTEKTLNTIEKLSNSSLKKEQDEAANNEPPPPPEGEILINFLIQMSKSQLATVQDAQLLAKQKHEGISDADSLEMIAQFFIESHKTE